jgi:hypothetical protein
MGCTSIERSPSRSLDHGAAHTWCADRPRYGVPLGITRVAAADATGANFVGSRTGAGKNESIPQNTKTP